MPRPVQVCVACALIWLLQLAIVPAPASAQSVGDLEEQARALRSRIEAQGERMSRANEAYHRAGEEANRIGRRAEAVQAEVDASEVRWNELKGQLGDRVRALYKRPAAALEVWLGARSLEDLQRATKVSTEVLAADSRLVTETEQARREVMARAERLVALRDEALRQEEEMARRADSVGQELARQRELLAGVSGEIAAAIEAQRQAEIAAARAAAEEEAAQAQAQAQAQAAPEPSPPTPEGETVPPPPAPPPSSGGGPRVHPNAGKAVATAAEQLGKPYEWAGSGPDSFDCSGLTSYAWQSAGVSIPRSSGAQYEALPKVSKDQLQPGDLVFFGNPIHHVGIYEGNGVMINAPQTGETVRRDSVNRRSDYTGAARP